MGSLWVYKSSVVSIIKLQGHWEWGDNPVCLQYYSEEGL